MATGNTIAEQIADIAASKAAIAAAISAKGVTVPSGAKLADLAPLVGQISGGGGGAADTCEIDRDTTTELVIPEGTTKIGNNAFYGCYELTSLTIPDSVTSIGSDAFNVCEALTSLTIPDSVTSIGSFAFQWCPTTCDITFAKTVAEVQAIANYPWGITAGAVIHCTDGDLTVS